MSRARLPLRTAAETPLLAFETDQGPHLSDAPTMRIRFRLARADSELNDWRRRTLRGGSDRPRERLIEWLHERVARQQRPDEQPRKTARELVGVHREVIDERALRRG